MVELGVNIDHVATLRQARRGKVPDVIAAAKVCELAGAHQITVHLREDRRHIQDRDVELLRQVLQVRLNLEMALHPEIIAKAEEVRPDSACLVPERREEVTTEGGLDVVANQGRIREVIARFHEQGIRVSLFIDPDPKQIEAAAALGAYSVELHTGAYANAAGADQKRELARLQEAARLVAQTPLALHAGHGLTTRNLPPVAQLPGLREVNIGHDIVALAVFIGLEKAVRTFLQILEKAAYGVSGESDT